MFTPSETAESAGVVSGFAAAAAAATDFAEAMRGEGGYHEGSENLFTFASALGPRTGASLASLTP